MQCEQYADVHGYVICNTMSSIFTQLITFKVAKLIQQGIDYATKAKFWHYQIDSFNIYSSWNNDFIDVESVYDNTHSRRHYFAWANLHQIGHCMCTCLRQMKFEISVIYVCSWKLVHNMMNKWCQHRHKCHGGCCSIEYPSETHLILPINFAEL